MEVAKKASRALEDCISPRDIFIYLCRLGDNEIDLRRFSSFSPSVYDTAWLSMVHRKEGEHIKWLFPESFQYILHHQLEDGSWSAYASAIDGIVNTLASLLSLLSRTKVGMPVSVEEGVELSRRIGRAKSRLQDMLQTWDIDETDRVGFEVLVPNLLLQVSQFGLHFEFPGQERLEQLHAQKRKYFCAESMYSGQQTPYLHSLEALVGIVDFDKLRHHCSQEHGMMGSPASTAAYLMNISTWDPHAELYLRRVVHEFSNLGAVPCAYPTCLFEISWVSGPLFIA
jgi:hypothetical protein